MTFALQLVHHGDVVEGDDGEHGLSSGQGQTLLQDGANISSHQLLSQTLVVGDEHDDEEEAVSYRQHAAETDQPLAPAEPRVEVKLVVLAHPLVFSMRSTAAGMAASRPVEPSGVAEPMLAKISSII